MQAEDDVVAEAPARPRRRWLRALAILFGGVLAVLAATIAVLDTGPGHRLIADRIASLKPSSGLRIRVGRIDGSIWNRVVLRDLRLYDPQGRFFDAPEIRLDWHPLAWRSNRLDIDRVSADLVTLDRLPRLHGKPGSPILPSFDIRIGDLRIARLRLGRAVGGTAADMRVAARADIRDRRAMIALDAASTRGDKARIDFDAAPDDGRFRLAADIASPSGGVIGGLVGTPRPLTLKVGGRGDWKAWQGQAQATLSGTTIADLGLTARDGRYALHGNVAPARFASGKVQRLTTPVLRVAGEATFDDRTLDGRLTLASPALTLATAGRIDLGTSSFGNLSIDTRLLKPAALFPNMTGRDVHLHVVLDGPFRTAAFRYALAAPHIAFDDTGFDQVRAEGAGHWSARPIAVPIRLSAARVTGLGDVAGGILGRLAIAGTLHVDAKTLVGQGLALTSDELRGRLGLRLDLVSGRYDIALSGGLQRYLIPGLGIVDVDSELSVVPGPGDVGTVVAGRGKAAVRRFDNAFLASLAGGLPRIDTQLVRSQDGVLHFSNLVLTGPAIRITGSGMRRRDGSFQFQGQGTQASYGPFRIALDGQIDHPKVDLLFDRPVDGLGLRAVTLNLDPVPNGFTFRASGGSYLGAFTADGRINVPSGGTTTIDIARLVVSGTRAAGMLRSDPGGFTGRLDVASGGIAGTIAFSPQGMIQRIEPHLTFAGATLAADVPIAVRRGKLDAPILLDPAGVTLSGQFAGAGIRRGGVSLARLSLGGNLKAGRGTIDVAAAGSRGRAFDLKGQAVVAPGRLTLTGQGTVDQKPISLLDPAVLVTEGNQWRLAPTRLGYDGGSATLAGLFSGASVMLDAGLDRMPLAVLDIVTPGLGLGGQVSGKLSYAKAGTAMPTGRLDLTIRGLSRAGLVLSSQPIDLAVAAALTRNGLAGRAVATSNGKTIGRAQARIAPLPAGTDTMDRLSRAPLFAQLRYVGPGDTLWRLTGVETIDLSGPLSVAADIGGTLDNPSIRGALRTEAGRIESAVTGTVVDRIKATGRFDGSRLVLDSMSGTAGGGTVSGRGTFDFSSVATRGVGMDLSLQAQDAQLLNRDELGATVTGPLAIKSTGQGGSITGDVELDRARYRLGAAASAQVSRLTVREINQPDDSFTDRAPPAPWTLDLKARSRNRLTVTGLGLDSEWRANLTIKGAVDNPAIGGSATMIQGRYEFAGRRFDIERGVIRFSGVAPPDPALDITAQANIQGLNASIRVTGTGLRPEIAFESVPALPEDELLSRLLFGTSIANLSAPEALQLATAVASLRSSGGGGGFNLDPINAVRKVVHLDRLRIVPADVTTGQKTSIAAGKYIGRRTYVEVITDGAGYSATSVEFRITRWLSLLSSVSTIGRQSANVRVSKDY